MKYAVYITEPAEAELERAYERLLEQTPQHAPLWHNGMVDAILSLEEMPSRCPLAPESKRGEQIRQILYGRPPYIYRILFTIRQEKVLILHLRHGARRRWRNR